MSKEAHVSLALLTCILLAVKSHIPLWGSRAFLRCGQYLMVGNKSTSIAPSSAQPHQLSVIRVACVACGGRAVTDLFLIPSFPSSFRKGGSQSSQPATSSPSLPVPTGLTCWGCGCAATPAYGTQLGCGEQVHGAFGGFLCFPSESSRAQLLCSLAEG